MGRFKDNEPRPLHLYEVYDCEVDYKKGKLVITKKTKTSKVVSLHEHEAKENNEKAVVLKKYYERKK